MNSLAVSSLDSFRTRRSSNTFKQNGTRPVIPQPQASTPSDNMSRTLPIVSSAVALASLGVAAYTLLKTPKSLKNVERKLEDIASDIAENKHTQETLANTINDVKKSVNTVKNSTDKRINGIQSNMDRQINGVKGEIDGIRNISRAPQVIQNFPTKNVEINGNNYSLATVMHGYGKEEGNLAKQLQTESARRILGAVKPVELPENAMIRIPTAEFTGFAKTGGLAIVPKELAANLGAVINNKQKAEIIVDTPMYIGQVENSKFFKLVKRDDGKFDYVSKSGNKEQVMATVSKIDEMEVPIHTYTDVVKEKVGVYMTDEMRAPVDYADTVAQFDEKTAQIIKDKMASGETYETPLVVFTPSKNVGESPKAEVKFKTVFYKNDKFKMDGPVQEGQIKNIYNNQTTQAGETEKFVYFGKFFYENLFSNHESSAKKLKADLIIGNDWHTGPISAMTRLLTPAKKAMGEVEPDVADKIQNVPIITIMHNFKLQGSVDHSQGKLLNVMFGEHAAKVAENAWMPKDSGMPGHLMNGLFSGGNLNPQTMAMTYADDIVFVSRGNFAEASGIMEKGGTNYALASMRGRTWQYGNHEYLEQIGMANGIRPEEIPHHATAKGITNGCDRVNNILNNKKARDLETVLKLKVGSLICDEKAIQDPFKAHQHNKGVILRDRVIPDIELARSTKGAENPMKIKDPEHTDLTGVDENTMVYGMAGRIVDQKGIDNWVAGIKERYMRGHYDKENPPVYYLQGIGDESFINDFMGVKSWLREIDPKASNRMVCAGLFSEAGRYDACKLMSDFSNMSSWDEPCGLVHKEIGYMSGAISIDNIVGGLTDGLKSYVRGGTAEQNKGANAIFVKFMDKDTHSKEEALKHNGQAWADAFETAEEWFHNKDSFAEGIKSSYLSRHDWLRGKVQEYVEIAKRHGVIADSVDSKYNEF